MADKKRDFGITAARQNILAGLLTIIPIWVTWLIVKFMVSLLTQVGAPGVIWIAKQMEDYAPDISEWLLQPWFQSLLAIILVIVVLYVLGVFARQMVGRKIIALFDALIEQIPFVQTVYGSVKKLLSVLQQRPDKVQRVVLIDFPSTEMKAIGLVTRTFADHTTGRELAAVYVPTTPNPTSGYLEIVPLDKIISTNWTLDEAMTFIISGGAVAPDEVYYDQSVASTTGLDDETMKTPEHGSK